MVIRTFTKAAVTSSPRKDFSDIPFEKLQEYYEQLLEDEIGPKLEEINTIKKNAYASAYKYAKKQIYMNTEESDEQENDGFPDFKPQLELDEDVLVKIKKDCAERAVLTFAEDYNIKQAWSWLGPQLMAHLGKYKMPAEKNEDGSYSVDAFLSLNVINAREFGIHKFITKVPRGALMDRQVDPIHVSYCGLVPLYMAAQKKFNGIKFSEWARQGVHYFVDAELALAMNAPKPLGTDEEGFPTKEELLEIRNLGLQYTSKAKATQGVVKSYSPETYHMLTGITHTCISNLSRYAKAMLTQIWCAHPVNRHEYMILNPYNWDDMPESLVSTSPLRKRIDNPVTTIFSSKDKAW